MKPGDLTGRKRLVPYKGILGLQVEYTTNNYFTTTGQYLKGWRWATIEDLTTGMFTIPFNIGE